MTNLGPLRDAISRLGHMSAYYIGDKEIIGLKTVTPRMLRAAESSPEFVVERFCDVMGQRWLWVTFARPVGPAVPSWAHTRGW
jgi:hypothetical protein